MRRLRTVFAWAFAGTIVATGNAAMITDYTVDAGGTNHDPLNGLAARATYTMSGSQLTILLENTSTGVPTSFDAADSLLVSLGFNLPTGVTIASGDSAVIGPGSLGLGSWTGRVAGDSVAEQWIWTNDFGGDLMESLAQIISTSNGQGGGTLTHFAGESGNVNGPFGGIAADPVLRPIPSSKPAVSDSLLFSLTLTGGLSEAQLASVADTAMVEYGSDARYLVTPEPAASVLALAGLLLARRRA